MFPKDYSYNKNEPELFAFRKDQDGKFNFARPDPAFWRHLEQRILDLQTLGIEADIILWHPYDRWGFKTMNREQDDRYLRYCIARLSAYRNVWWSFANEFDLMSAISLEDWHDYFKLVRQQDPYDHLRSIHNCRVFYDHSLPWVTHASIQSSDLAAAGDWIAKLWKPAVYDECCYEGDIEMPPELQEKDADLLKKIKSLEGQVSYHRDRHLLREQRPGRSRSGGGSERP